MLGSPPSNTPAPKSQRHPSRAGEGAAKKKKEQKLTDAVSADDQVKAYIKRIMSQLDKWMVGGKISKLVIVITDKDTGEHVERWQFDVCLLPPANPLPPSRASEN